MSTYILSVRELRSILSSVLDKVYKKFDRCIITKRGKPEGVLMSIDDYESLIETLDIEADKETMKRIRKADKELKAGKGKSIEKIHKELGIV